MKGLLTTCASASRGILAAARSHLAMLVGPTMACIAMKPHWMTTIASTSPAPTSDAFKVVSLLGVVAMAIAMMSLPAVALH